MSSGKKKMSSGKIIAGNKSKSIVAVNNPCLAFFLSAAQKFGVEGGGTLFPSEFFLRASMIDPNIAKMTG